MANNFKQMLFNFNLKNEQFMNSENKPTAL